MEASSMNQPILEKKDLFASIRACGLQIDDSLLQEFQEQGVMLPAAQRRGRGRAKGNRGLWTLQQRDLLRTLCMMRQKQNIHSIAQRCNLIIWIWLYWGDEWGVTLAQVQQVMKTWATYQQRSSLKIAHQEARRVVGEVANHSDGGKQQAIRDITELFYNGTYTTQNLYESLYSVFDPQKTANGPYDLPITPEAISMIIPIRKKAVDTLLLGPNIPDIDWEWARHFHLFEFGEYLPHQRIYAQQVAASPAEHLFTVDTLETLVSTACADLATVLGMGLAYSRAPFLPDHLRLDFWKRKVQCGRVLSRQVISPILYLDGSRSQSLHICETLTLFPEGEEREKSKPEHK